MGGCGRTGGTQASIGDTCGGAVGGCPNLYVVPVLSPGDTLEAHGLTGNGAPLWSMAGATRSLPDEQLWGEVKAATDLACYNREVDEWHTIPAGDTVLIYDRLTLDGSKGAWLHVNAFWNAADEQEAEQTIFGFGGPQVNCFIPMF